MKKQTVTDYLYKRVMDIFIKYHEEDVPTFDFSKAMTEAFEQAKEMEKEQIIDSYLQKRGKRSITGVLNCMDEAYQYYNETYEL